MKICCRCNVEKDIKDFHRSKKDKCGRKPACKECRNSENKGFYNKNSKKVIARQIKRYDEKKEEILDKQKERYEEDKDEILLRNRERYIDLNLHEKYKETRDTWVYNNKEKLNTARRKRRALKHKVEENFTPEQAKEVMERFVHKCFNCDSEDKLHIDHHRPLSKGHALTPSNAVILCQFCNLSKGPKNPEDFYDKDKYNELENKLRSI